MTGNVGVFPSMSLREWQGCGIERRQFALFSFLHLSYRCSVEGQAATQSMLTWSLRTSRGWRWVEWSDSPRLPLSVLSASFSLKSPFLHKIRLFINDIIYSSICLLPPSFFKNWSLLKAKALCDSLPWPSSYLGNLLLGRDQVNVGWVNEQWVSGFQFG